MFEPLISIVLPTYNGDKFIEKSIDSILNQTYQNFELIIVNDASTDKTSEIIYCIQKRDARIKIIENEVNKKLPSSLNIGFKYATGEFLTWTSDDNIYTIDAFEVMLRCFNESPEIDIVFSDYYLINDFGEIIDTISKPEIDNLIYGNCIGASFLYRRLVQEKLVGYNEDLYLAEDYDFWIRASIYFTFFHIKKNLYFYRMHDKSLTSKYATKAYTLSLLSLFNNFETLIKSQKFNEDDVVKHIVNQLLVNHEFRELVFNENFNWTSQSAKKVLNSLIILMNQYKDERSKIEKSINYKLSRLILTPFRILKNVFNKS